jgi:hypothetical protein
MSWLENNIPLFECPDKELEEVYYFRWWIFRKHIKETNEGFIITEFHSDVPWAGKDLSFALQGTISMRAGGYIIHSI